MKRNLSIIFILALCLVSCSKEAIKTGTEIKIRASIQSEQEKTTLSSDNVSVLWESQDEVKLFLNGEGAKAVSNNSTAAATTEFTGNFSSVISISESLSDATPIWGLYPYRDDATADNSSVTTTLVSEQNGKAGSFASGTLICLGRSASLAMGFYNVCGGLRFSLKNNAVKNIVFQGLNNENLAGTIKIVFQDGKPAVSAVSDGAKAITLSAPSGGCFAAGQWYYIVALPTVLEKGFSIRFNTADKYAVLKSDARAEIKRGVFGSLENADDGLEYKSEPDKPKARYNWFEHPLITDADNDGICDTDKTLYYAYHLFEMDSKKYRNYTVCYSAKHHCPLWVAAPRHAVYETKGTSRSDAYKQDPDIPSSVQYSSKDTGGDCNKGHMLGSSERLCCAEANRQVFYYTNIAPQLSSGFNTGGGGWNTLEDWMDKKVCADTLYEVVGCYFEDYTDGYGYMVAPKTISFGGRSDVTRPSMFYYAVLRTKKGNSGKSVLNCSSDELMCVAFVRSHTNSLKGQKVSSKEMMSISDLEKITGQKYFVNVPNAPKTTFNASDWGL